MAPRNSNIFASLVYYWYVLFHNSLCFFVVSCSYFWSGLWCCVLALGTLTFHLSIYPFICVYFRFGVSVSQSVGTYLMLRIATIVPSSQ